MLYLPWETTSPATAELFRAATATPDGREGGHAGARESPDRNTASPAGKGRETRREVRARRRGEYYSDLFAAAETPLDRLRTHQSMLLALAKHAAFDRVAALADEVSRHARAVLDRAQPPERTHISMQEKLRVDNSDPRLRLGAALDVLRWGLRWLPEVESEHAIESYAAQLGGITVTHLDPEGRFLRWP